MDLITLAAIHRQPSATNRIINHLASLESDIDTSALTQETFLNLGIPPEKVTAFLTSLSAVDRVDTDRKIRTLKISVITRTDRRYPPYLLATAYPPPILYVRGNIEVLSAPMLAVVGTRQPSDYGQRATKILVEPLTRRGLPIVSGLAYGIDALAHEIALANHAPTVAIFGTGLDLTYPASHRDLADRIVEHGGALVSEFPLGSGPERHHFPQRNRIISGLSRAVLLVEARVKSGALVTAKFAVDQNRDLYVVPGDIDRETAAGPLSWLRLGATPVTSAADIISSFPQTVNPAPVSRKRLISADPTEQTLLDILSSADSLHIDEILEQCKLDASVVTAVLALLEIRGVIRHLGGMRYTAVS